jgi:hypothetical protein
LIEKTHGHDLVDAPAAVKRRARMIKNRLSAKRSREQARDYVAKLENTVKVLSAESELLARRLAQVEAENRMLRLTGSADAPSSTSSSSLRTVALSEDKQEKGRITAEPAALRKSSLQLDAFLLFMVASSASGEVSVPSTDALLRLRPILMRATNALLASKPVWLNARPRPRFRTPTLMKSRKLMRLPHLTTGLQSQSTVKALDGLGGDQMH